MQKVLVQIVFSLFLLQPLSVFASVPALIDNSSLLNLDLRVFLAARPITVILVEKDQQRLRVLKHDGRMHVVAEYTAVTGEKEGRKVVEGDEKTPEGIYFITKKYIDTKVTVFGTRAFHLNYPNVFDVRDGRGGNGIFIHGTNKPLRRNSTNGCITLNNRDLDELADYLNIGRIPVIIVDSLKPGQEEIEINSLTPKLADGNFAVAKRMLLPDYAPRDAEFVSIYMLRANNQVVIAGEYKGLGGSLKSYAAGYYDTNAGTDMVVLERIPGDRGQLDTHPNSGVASLAPIAGASLPNTGGQSSLSDFGRIWRPKQEDVYLSWYRESLRQNPQIKEAIAQQPLPAPEGLPTKLVYGLFILASCVSIGSALFFIRSQLRQAEKWDCGHDVSVVLDKGMNAAPLRKDLQKVKETLQLMQDHVQREASLMDSEVQARIEDLENGLAEKKAEIEQLTAEKAALKLKSMSHMSGQIQELGDIKQELRAAEEKLEDAREGLAKLPVLEEMLAAQKEEMQQLALEKATISMELREGAASQESSNNSLREQVAELQEQLAAQTESLTGQAAKEAQEKEELSKELAALQLSVQTTELELQTATEEKYTLQEQLAQVEKLEVELQQSQAEKEKLLFDNERLKEKADTSDVDEKLERLQQKLAESNDDLQVSQSRNAHLAQQLSDRDSLQRELGEKVSEIELLHSEMATLKVASDTSALEDHLLQLQDDLAGVRGDLEVSVSRNEDLAKQLGDRDCLEQELSTKQAEIDKLSIANKEFEKLQEDFARIRGDLEVSVSRNEDLAKQLSDRDLLEQELSTKKAEVEKLSLDKKELEVAADNSDIEEQLAAVEQKLASSREELCEQESTNRELTDKLQEKDLLEKELAERSAALETITLENKALVEAAAQNDLKVELAELKEELSEARVELELANQQSASLAETNKRLRELEELMLARQVEVTSLKNQLQAQKEAASADFDASRKELLSQIDELNKELQQTREVQEVIAAAPAVAVDDDSHKATRPEDVEAVDTSDFEAEVSCSKEEVVEETKPVEDVAEIVEKTTPPAANSASLAHGNKFLPSDILDKWMTG